MYLVSGLWTILKEDTMSEQTNPYPHNSLFSQTRRLSLPLLCALFLAATSACDDNKTSDDAHASPVDDTGNKEPNDKTTPQPPEKTDEDPAKKDNDAAPDNTDDAQRNDDNSSDTGSQDTGNTDIGDPDADDTDTGDPDADDTDTGDPDADDTDADDTDTDDTDTEAPNVCQSSQVVIHEIYAHGGNAGAIWQNDYIVLHNRSDLAVDLEGWSLQYAPAAGNFGKMIPLSDVLEGGQYLLIQLAASSDTGMPLPGADLVAEVNLAANGGILALVDHSEPLKERCTGNDIRDLVGYGSSPRCFEGWAKAPAPTATRSLQRIGEGCKDDNDNSQDFEVADPQGKSLTSDPHICFFCDAGVG